MHPRALHFYHSLPGPVRSLAATLRGYRLRWWRYGGNAEDLVAQALERDHWPAERLKSWTEERLARMLHRAATVVPFYREHWAERRRRGDRSSWERLEHWPLLSKDTLRKQPQAFRADDSPVGSLFEVHTSGTTGKPLTLWRSRAATREYYALLEARYRRWHGVSWRNSWAILGGQAVVPPGRETPPFWVHNRAMRQLYLSANHVSARNAGAFVDALEQYRVDHLVAYSSSATELARRCLESGRTYRGFRVVVTNAEPLHAEQRAAIEAAFGVPARETYGMVEIVAGASECPSGARHLWPDLGQVEVFSDDAETPAGPGQSGRLVCTGLVNDAMPLIRYVTGDRGSLPGLSNCSCGKTLPLMGPIEGRSNDMLIAPDGRRVFWLNPVFYGLPLHEAQIEQQTIDQITVRLVPASGFGADAQDTIVERLQSRMGEVQVRLERVNAIPRGPNGKFQAVVCRVPRDQAEPSGAAV